MPSTPSGKPEPQDPPGTKPFHLHAGWVLEGILALVSAEHLCWAPWEAALCSPHPGQLAIFFMPKGPRVPAPAHGQKPGKGAQHIASAIPVGVWWSLVLSKDEGIDAGDPLGEAGGICAFTASQTFLLGLGLFFLLLHCLVSLSQAAMGRSPFTRSVSKERPNFPRGEAPTCCHPSCSHWLQQERATLRSAGAQAMVLLPTTTACAASRKCRRCRARFCTNLG